MNDSDLLVIYYCIPNYFKFTLYTRTNLHSHTRSHVHNYCISHKYLNWRIACSCYFASGKHRYLSKLLYQLNFRIGGK